MTRLFTLEDSKAKLQECIDISIKMKAKGSRRNYEEALRIVSKVGTLVDEAYFANRKSGIEEVTSNES
jgi:hypothetical protein